jgi:predicted transcriptional regulator
MMNMKTAKQLERYFKGSANHHRINVLILVEKKEGITVEGIANSLDKNMKTMAEHITRLVHAGLLDKKYKGRSVTHSLSPYGKKFLKFMRTF